MSERSNVVAGVDRIGFGLHFPAPAGGHTVYLDENGAEAVRRAVSSADHPADVRHNGVRVGYAADIPYLVIEAGGLRVETPLAAGDEDLILAAVPARTNGTAPRTGSVTRVFLRLDPEDGGDR